MNEQKEEELTNLLKEWGLEHLFSILKENGIKYSSLKYLSKEDIKDAIPTVGDRAEFREKLFAWRKKELNIDDNTISVGSKVSSWLQQNNSSPISSVQQEKLNVLHILQSNTTGRSILNYFEKFSKLTNKQRDDLIRLIIEEANFTNLIIRTGEFQGLVDQISTIFPCEKDSQEYYFIPRKNNKNPSGKLYIKYTNSRLKRRRILENRQRVKFLVS